MVRLSVDEEIGKCGCAFLCAVVPDRELGGAVLVVDAEVHPECVALW